VKRRTVLALGGAAVVTGAAVAAGMSAATPYMSPRALPSGKLLKAKDIDLTFGYYRLTIKAKKFAVTMGDRTLWTTSGPFLLTGNGRNKWADKLGHFTRERDLESVQNNLRISGATVDGGLCTVRPGQLADLALLDADPLHPGEPEDVARHLRGMHVATTIVAGQVVHDAR